MKVEIRDKAGVKLWYYDFTMNRNRYRGWLLPPDAMSKRQAIAEVGRVRAEIVTDDSPITRRNSKTYDISAALSRYEDYLKESRDTTYNRIKYMFANLKFFNSLPEITQYDIQRYQKKRLAEGVSGPTVNRELSVARSAMNRAIRDGQWKKVNPFANYAIYHEEARTRYLSEDELARLLYASKLVSMEHKCPHTHDIILLAILMGRRKREILNLHASQIELVNRTILKKATGTKKNMRDEYTHIPEIAFHIIKKKIKESKTGYLFENKKTEKPLTDIKKSFKTALRIAEIEGFRFHDLRHTFATYALLATRDIRSVQEVIGHSTIAMTSRYAHVTESTKRETMEATGCLISTAMGGKINSEKLDNRKGKNGY